MVICTALVARYVRGLVHMTYSPKRCPTMLSLITSGKNSFPLCTCSRAPTMLGRMVPFLAVTRTPSRLVSCLMAFKRESWKKGPFHKDLAIQREKKTINKGKNIICLWNYVELYTRSFIINLCQRILIDIRVL